MKKHILKLSLLSLALVAVGTFSACKKGENDPGISLRSRKARVVGEWKLQKGTIKSTNGGNAETITFDDGKGTIADNLGTDNFTYSWEFTFDSDGTYTASYTETYTGDSPSIEKTEGRWAFLGKNKDNDLKNKEAILLTRTSRSYSYNGNTSTSTESNATDGEIWMIDQLDNDLMVIKSSNKYSDTGSGGSSSGTSDAELTFWAK